METLGREPAEKATLEAVSRTEFATAIMQATPKAELDVLVLLRTRSEQPL